MVLVSSTDYVSYLPMPAGLRTPVTPASGVGCGSRSDLPVPQVKKTIIVWANVGRVGKCGNSKLSLEMIV